MDCKEFFYYQDIHFIVNATYQEEIYEMFEKGDKYHLEIKYELVAKSKATLTDLNY